jgi:osmotically-inducible protein OsmY
MAPPPPRPAKRKIGTQDYVRFPNVILLARERRLTMTVPKAIAGVLISLAVGGCTRAQIEAAKIVKTGSEVLDTYRVCVAPMEANPEYAWIYEKLGVATNKDPDRMPSQMQMSDNTKISNEDIARGLNWYAKIQECSLPAIASLAEIDPGFQIAFAQSQSEITDIINEVVSVKPSYGHVNQRLYVLKLHQKDAAKQIAQSLRGRLAIAHQQELQQRQAVAQSVAELALDTLLTLATRQVVLIRSARQFAVVYPPYQISKLQAIKCSSSMLTALDISARNAKNEIIQGYGTRGLSTDPRSNTSLAQELAAVDARAMTSASAAGCPR